MITLKRLFLVCFVIISFTMEQNCGYSDPSSGNALSVLDFSETFSELMDVKVEGILPKNAKNNTSQCFDTYTCLLDCGHFQKGCTIKARFLGFLNDGVSSPDIAKAYIDTCILKKNKSAKEYSWMKTQLLSIVLNVIKKKRNCNWKELQFQKI